MSSKTRFFNPEEQVLAIKISFLVLFGIFLCFLFLISLNGLYLLISAKTRFSEDIDTFQEIAKTGLINDFSFFSRDNPLLAAETKSLIERLSEDIIIIRKDGKVEKNGFFENVAIEYELFKSTETGIYSKKVQDRVFLFFRYELQGNTIFFTHEITDIGKFQTNLILNALLLSLLFFLVVYLISVKLAQVTLKPIQENNERLKEYNHYVAHELKTPLAILRSNIELSELSQDKKLIASSKEEVASMESIIDGLLFLSESAIKKDKSSVTLGEFLKDMVKKKYSKYPINILSSGSDVSVQADEFLLERLLQNLLDNALKYSSKGSEINVKITKKHLVIENEIEHDFKLADLRRLLEPFYQIDTSRSTKGHGLGLAIVKRIVDILGWKVSLDKKEKRFFVTINF